MKVKGRDIFLLRNIRDCICNNIAKITILHANATLLQ